MAVSLQQKMREGLIAIINAFNSLQSKLQPSTISINMLGAIGICWDATSPAEVGFKIPIPDATAYSNAVINNIANVNLVDMNTGSSIANVSINSVSITTKTCGSAVIRIKVNSALTNNHFYRFYGTQPILVLS